MDGSPSLHTARDLRARADALLFDGAYTEALAAYLALARIQPAELDARLRVADSLLALGQVQAAAVVYTALARHAAQAGYPLRALVALKQLAMLEPQLGVLLQGIADLYAAGSARIGRSVRRAPPDPGQALPEGLDVETKLDQDVLVAQAQDYAADYAALAGTYPDTLPPVPLFSELPAKDFGAMLGAMELVRVRPGAVVIAEGEPGDAFYVLARGSVRVTKRGADGEVELATLHEGAILGEMALFCGESRSATVTAVGDSDLLCFGERALTAAAAQAQTVARALSRFAQQRLIQNLLATAPLFKPLDRAQRLDLMRRFTAYDVAPHTPIIRQGEPGRGLFIVLKGQVEVSRDDGEGDAHLATLKAGDIFGELALLNDEPASATVTSGAQATLLFLAREYFQRLTGAVPEIRDYVEQLGEERLMDMRLTMDALPALEIDLDLE